jgi:hypothetical protein
MLSEAIVIQRVTRVLRPRGCLDIITHQMRTTLDIDPEILNAAKELGRQQGRTAGEVLSELARQGLRAAMAAPSSADQEKEPASFFGFRPFSARGTPVTNETIDRLRDELSV